MYTDWTAIGTTDDLVAPQLSAVPENKPLNHKVLYDRWQFVPTSAHGDIIDRTSGSGWDYDYCDYNSTNCSMNNQASWYQTNDSSNDPIRMARWANYSPSY